MNIVGLFSGIGGLELGFRRAGHACLLHCEISMSAQSVLRRHFPGVDLISDVRDVVDLPRDADAIVGGFPCQDLSQAGNTLGISGSKSGLIDDVFRIVGANRPKWIVLENVPFMLQLNKGEAIRKILNEFEDLGYLWAYRVVDTFGFGLPQRRQRVFIVASRVADPSDVLLVDDVELKRPSTSIATLAHGFYWTEGRSGLGWAVDAVPTLKNGSTIGIPSPPAILLPDGRIIKPDIRDAERLQGFDEDWTFESESVARGGVRWSLVGNAVSVPVAEWLGDRLMKPKAYDHGRDASFDGNRTMPLAARFDGQRRFTVDINIDPIGERPVHLHEFLRYEGLPLSEKATQGFLSRTRGAKLRFVDGFIASVEGHLERMRA